MSTAKYYAGTVSTKQDYVSMLSNAILTTKLKDFTLALFFDGSMVKVQNDFNSFSYSNTDYWNMQTGK